VGPETAKNIFGWNFFFSKKTGGPFKNKELRVTASSLAPALKDETLPEKKIVED